MDRACLSGTAVTAMAEMTPSPESDRMSWSPSTAHVIYQCPESFQTSPIIGQRRAFDQITDGTEVRGRGPENIPSVYSRPWPQPPQLNHADPMLGIIPRLCVNIGYGLLYQAQYGVYYAHTAIYLAENPTKRRINIWLGNGPFAGADQPTTPRRRKYRNIYLTPRQLYEQRSARSIRLRDIPGRYPGTPTSFYTQIDFHTQRPKVSATPQVLPSPTRPQCVDESPRQAESPLKQKAIRMNIIDEEIPEQPQFSRDLSPSTDKSEGNAPATPSLSMGSSPSPNESEVVEVAQPYSPESDSSIEEPASTNFTTSYDPFTDPELVLYPGIREASYRRAKPVASPPVEPIPHHQATEKQKRSIARWKMSREMHERLRKEHRMKYLQRKLLATTPEAKTSETKAQPAIQSQPISVDKDRKREPLKELTDGQFNSQQPASTRPIHVRPELIDKSIKANDLVVESATTSAESSDLRRSSAPVASNLPSRIALPSIMSNRVANLVQQRETEQRGRPSIMTKLANFFRWRRAMVSPGTRVHCVETPKHNRKSVGFYESPRTGRPVTQVKKFVIGERISHPSPVSSHDESSIIAYDNTTLGDQAAIDAQLQVFHHSTTSESGSMSHELSNQGMVEISLDSTANTAPSTAEPQSDATESSDYLMSGALSDNTEEVDDSNSHELSNQGLVENFEDPTEDTAPPAPESESNSHELSNQGLVEIFEDPAEGTVTPTAESGMSSHELSNQGLVEISSDSTEGEAGSDNAESSSSSENDEANNPSGESNIASEHTQQGNNSTTDAATDANPTDGGQNETDNTSQPRAARRRHLRERRKNANRSSSSDSDSSENSQTNKRLGLSSIKSSEDGTLPHELQELTSELTISPRRRSGRQQAIEEKHAKERAAREQKEAEEKAQREREEAELRAQIAREAEAQRERLGIRRYTKDPIIQPLSTEWNTKVDEALARGPASQVATTSTGNPITRRDIGKVLPQPNTGDDPAGWLNDEVIAAYLQAVVDLGHAQVGHRRTDIPKFHAFNTFFYTNLQRPGGYDNVKRWARRAKIGGRDLEEVERVFIPVNASGAHWTLAVVSPTRKTIEYFDSMHGSASAVVANVRAWLAGELGSAYDADEWIFREDDERLRGRGQGPTQNNYSDCGVFAATTAKMVVLGVEPCAVTAGDMPLQRRRMVAELLNGGFSGDFEPLLEFV